MPDAKTFPRALSYDPLLGCIHDTTRVLGSVSAIHFSPDDRPAFGKALVNCYNLLRVNHRKMIEVYSLGGSVREQNSQAVALLGLLISECNAMFTQPLQEPGK